VRLRARVGPALVVLAACGSASPRVASPPAHPSTAPSAPPPITPATSEASPPFETTTASFLVDAGAPAWLRDRVTADVARSFDFYAAKLGPLPPPKATVHLAFGTRPHGLSIGGEARPGNVVLLRLELEPGAADGTDGALRLAVDELVAHEAAHLWADPHTAGDESQRWMHEGLPDAFALRALRATGAMSDAEYLAALSEAASECALWLSDGQPLTAATRPGHARAFYVCGSTIQLIAEAACRRRDPTTNLFALWRAIFDEGQRDSGEASFFGTLNTRGGPDAMRGVLTLVRHGSTDPWSFLRDLLLRAGVSTGVHLDGSATPMAYEQHASVPAASALLPLSCAAALAFEGDSEVLPRIASEGACPGLAKGDRLESLAGNPIGPKGATAWDAGYASCQSRHAVDVGVRGNTVTVPCDPAARPRPAYFEVRAAP
jgi:hypothetical protein